MSETEKSLTAAASAEDENLSEAEIQAREKEERAKERARKKEQEALKKAIELSKKEAKNSAAKDKDKDRHGSNGSKEKGKSSSSGSGSGSNQDFSGLGAILVDGFNSLKDHLGGLQSSLTDGFASVNDNLGIGFETLYYGDGEEETRNADDVEKLDVMSDVTAAGSESPIPIVDEEGDGAVSSGPGNSCSSLASGPTNPFAGIQSMFAKLAKEIVTPSETSENVSPDLARLVNEHCLHPLSLEQFNALKRSYKRPGNCEQLQVPFVPEVIWNRLDSVFRGRDKAWQNIQEDVMAITTAVVQGLQGLDDVQVSAAPLLSSSASVIPAAVKDCLQDQGVRLNKVLIILMDALRMAGYVHRMGLTERRRETLKPKLPGDFKRLAGSSFAPSAGSLFGDIIDNVKQISETSKLSSQMDAAGKKQNSGGEKGNSAFRFSPYNLQRGRGRGFFANRRARGRGRGFRGSGRGNAFSPQPSTSTAGVMRQDQNPSSSQGFRGRGAQSK